MDVDQHLSLRIRGLRMSQSMTLETLSGRSGVSRSMISLIERGRTSPTAAVLSKLANAFGVTLASLFTEQPPAGESPVARLTDQSVWVDPASGYVRRQLSPAVRGSILEMAEVTFPAGQAVSFEHPSGRGGEQQQVWMLDGEMSVTAGGETWHLKRGDCLAMRLDQQVGFSNPARQPARYLIATAAPHPRRTHA